MKLSKIILTFLMLFAVVQFCAGQEKPKAVLVHEFGKVTCEQTAAHFDDFLVQLRDELGSGGFVVIYTRENLNRSSFDYLNRWGAWLDHRRFDSSQITVIRAKKDTEIEMQLWKIPAGAEKPSIEGTEWSKTLPSSAKPFVFTSDDNRGLCYFFSPKDYADFLNANPTARGHLVVYETTRKTQRAEAEYMIKSLAKFNIPRSRLKIFYAKTNFAFTGTTLWIVPARKK